MSIQVTAFLLGLMGSLHCAGMCGPIALALPLPGRTRLNKAFGGLIYNIGRTLTYTLMGFLFGLLGKGIYMIGFQQKVSVIMGVIMVISAFFPSVFRNTSALTGRQIPVFARLKESLGRLFAIKSFGSLFTIGLLNGLLPCGLVYVGIAGAIGVGEPSLAALYMFLFGLGTIPMMLAIALAGNFLSMAARNRLNRYIPILVAVVGILFILRGLNLGIPYLSPTEEIIKSKFEKSLTLEAPPEADGSCCGGE